MNQDTDMQQEYNRREGWKVSAWAMRNDLNLWTMDQIEKIDALCNVSVRMRKLSKTSIRVETTTPVRWAEDSHDLAADRGEALIEKILNDLGFDVELSHSWAEAPSWLFKR